MTKKINRDQYAWKLSHKSIAHRLAKLVEEIWNKADSCPYSDKTIAKLFEREIWDKYKFILHEHYLPGESLPSTRKRSHKKDPSKQKQWCIVFFILNIYLNFSLLLSYQK